MSYALIVNGEIVAESHYLPSAGAYMRILESALPDNHQFYAMTVQLVDGVPTQVWTELPLATARDNMIANLEEKRHQVETAGITVNGLSVQTDPDTLNLLTRARAAINAGVTSFPYLFASGWQDINATTADAMLLAAGQHIQTCATNHQALWTAIMAAADQAGLAAIDIGGGWPT